MANPFDITLLPDDAHKVVDVTDITNAGDQDNAFPAGALVGDQYYYDALDNNSQPVTVDGAGNITGTLGNNYFFRLFDDVAETWGASIQKTILGPPVVVTGAVQGQAATTSGTVNATTPSASATFNIAGGANLTGLQVCVFAGYNVGADPILAQFVGETSDGSANIVVDLAGSGALNGDPVAAVVSDFTTTPTPGSSGAVCYSTVVVA